jgi:SET domain-containing protein
MRLADGKRVPPFETRRSPIHGTGVFATRRIRKGGRVVEYVGERVSHAEADRRYEDKDANDSHTFLFIVDRRTVIDAGVGGNAARFVNHSCAPNCETVIEDRRVFIYALRDIDPGEELTYDYLIQREPDDPPDVEEVFSCRCGDARCRGTMLAPKHMPRRNRAAEDRGAKRVRRTG